MHIPNRLLRGWIVFLSGGFAYGLFEIMFRGYTHITMGFLGGTAMCLIHLLNRGARSPAVMIGKLLLSAVCITLSELAAGELLNVRLGLDIWDYSKLPMNYDGQICLYFSVLWFTLSAVGVLLDDLLRSRLLYPKTSDRRLRIMITKTESTAA